MAKISGHITIDRPIGEVFDFVVDERNEPLYNPELLRSEKVTAGPIGVGTRFRATHRQGKHTIDMTVEVTDYVRPRRMASMTTTSKFDVEGKLSFDPVRTATKMGWEWEVRPKGTWRALTPIVGLVGGRSERACWEGLKRYLEHPQRRPSPTVPEISPWPVSASSGRRGWPARRRPPPTPGPRPAVRD